MADCKASNPVRPCSEKAGERISIMPRTKKAISVLALFLFSALSLSVGAQNKQEAISDFEINVPVGTIIPIVLTAYLNSRSSQVGDTVYAETHYPVWIQQRLAIPKGSLIRGTVTEVVRPGRIKGKGRIAIRFNDLLLPNGVKRDMVASFHGIHGSGEETLDRKKETVSAGSSKGSDAGTIAGPTASGAGIGAIAGGGKGAGIGAGVGSAIGIAQVLLTRGKDIVLGPGDQFDLELQQDLTFSFNELEFTDSELRSVQRTVRKTPARNQSRPALGGRLPGLGIPF
jgi:hypothetical protein